MKHCPNCGVSVTTPEHIADECHQCGEPIGLWYLDSADDEELPRLDAWFWLLVGACVTALSVWFVKSGT